jgi:hypothetical protein
VVDYLYRWCIISTGGGLSIQEVDYLYRQWIIYKLVDYLYRKWVIYIANGLSVVDYIYRQWIIGPDYLYSGGLPI